MMRSARPTKILAAVGLAGALLASASAEAAAAVQAAMPSVPGPQTGGYLPERLMPAPDGRLWDLSDFLASTASSRQVSLSVLDAAGTPLVRDRINLVSLPGELPLDPAVVAIPSQGKLIVMTQSRSTGRETLYRLREDGSLDTGWRRVALPTDLRVTQILPWHGGAIVVSSDGRVAWISSNGGIVRQRRLPAGASVAFDTAWRLAFVAGRQDRKGLTVRRLRANGRLDPSFGTVRLSAAGRLLEGLGIVAAPGGRLLVVARSLATNPGAVRDDFYLPHATVVWRIRTR